MLRTLGQTLGIGHHTLLAVIEVRVVGAIQNGTDRVFDIAKTFVLLGGEQRESGAALARAGRTADAVDVVLGRAGNVIVDDMGNAVDVNAASHDVRRHEHARVTALEALEGLLALGLRAIAVNRRAADTAAVEDFGDAIGAMLRAGEDQHTLKSVIGDETHEQVGFLLTAYGVDRLSDRLDRSGYRGDRDVCGIVERRVDELEDLLGHGRREQEVLTLRRHECHDALHVGRKAHIEHAVGLVEDEHLHVGEVDVTTADEVEKSARSGDEYVDATSQRPLLWIVADAAVHDCRTVTSHLGRSACDFIDLNSELTRRGDDECLDAAGLCGDALQQREDERRGLSGAGLRTADNIAALEHDRNRIALDGGGLGVAHRGDRR